MIALYLTLIEHGLARREFAIGDHTMRNVLGTANKWITFICEMTI